MQRNPQLDRFGMFSNPENITSKQLEYALSGDLRVIPGFELYLQEIGKILPKILAKDNPLAEALIQDYVDKCDINVSSDKGGTLLHTLLIYNRPDLAKIIIESSNFKKINFKFRGPMCNFNEVSALDLAISMWLSPESAVSLEFIELLLMHGATLPKPNEKFSYGDFVSVIFPDILHGEAEEHPDALVDGSPVRTIDQIKDLFCLLYRYGFSVAEMENEFRRRLSDTKENSIDWIKKFIPIERQKSLFDGFMQKLHAACKDLPKCKPIVGIDDERLEKGEKTLNLPSDPSDRPCCALM